MQTAVNTCRRKMVDQSVGQLAGQLTWATAGIRELGEKAGSEAGRLAALKAVFANMVGLSKFAGLELRITEIEERLDAGSGSTD